MKKYTIGFLFILVFMFIGTNQSFACSCMMPPSPSEAKESATSVFIGKVNTVKDTSFTNDLMGSYKKNVVTFDILNNIKGESSNTITISTAKDSSACGYNFEIGKEYIVYTYGDEDEQEVNICSRTSEAKYAQDDIEELKVIVNDSNNNSGTTNEEVNTSNIDNGNSENTNTGEVDNNLGNINTIDNGNDNENLDTEDNKKINEVYVPILLIMISILIIIFGSIILNKKR